MSNEKLKVCIVGGGAAGTAAAWSLSRFPEKYDIQLWEKQKRTGGQATSEPINAVQTYINDGVQGGPISFRNTFELHRRFGFTPSPAEMRISFGKGENNWNNYSETQLVKRLKHEIRRFGTVLKIIKTFEVIFAFLPIYRVLKIFRFSDDFINLMVMPLVALFFGTGNQTPHVSSAVVCRVFLDPDLKLFSYDPDRMVSEQPKMFAFPKLGDIYEVIAKAIQGKVYLNRPVMKVQRDHNGIIVTDTEGTSEVFDRLIFACDPETILKITSDLTWLERRLLSNVKYFDDVTVTHTDEEYMHKYYDMDMKNKDLYLIKTDPKDTQKLDMSFNLTFYQPQLSDKRPYVFQTIFLNKENGDKWTMNEIRKDKIQLVKWWRQMSHTWKHFATWVPFQMLIQGTKHTFYTGSYTLVNTHEIATISGLAAAARLGAPYPFEHDKLAKKQFDGYSLVVHGRVFTKGKISTVVTMIKAFIGFCIILQILLSIFK